MVPPIEDTQKDLLKLIEKKRRRREARMLVSEHQSINHNEVIGLLCQQCCSLM